jgi:hypothetical protein
MRTFMPKSPAFPRPLVISPGMLAAWISKHWKLSRADRMKLELTAIHEPDAVMEIIDRLWAEYRGTPRIPKAVHFPKPYTDKNGTILTADQFDGDWPFVDKPPNMNAKLGAKIKKLADAARAKKSKRTNSSPI